MYGDGLLGSKQIKTVVASFFEDNLPRESQ